MREAFQMYHQNIWQFPQIQFLRSLLMLFAAWAIPSIFLAQFFFFRKFIKAAIQVDSRSWPCLLTFTIMK
jgi:hypothetical protein